MTATGMAHERGDLYVRDGKIAGVGSDLSVPSGTTVIDVSGTVITPGLIDTHSHIGVYPAPAFVAHQDANEAVSPTTPHVSSADGYWPQDPQLDRARAGGITTLQILPGSANLIGGSTFTMKTYLGARSAEDARFVAAPRGLKIACGENPKRTYGEKGGPQTRMGNMAGFRRAFEQARAYAQKWRKYREALAAFEHAPLSTEPTSEPKLPPDPPDHDLGLEALAGVLAGNVLVHNHCYRADEMIVMMEIAESFGFRIRSFHHAVEAYKIADRLAAHGASASVWADWWGFKAEAFDGIRENAALVHAASAKAIIHSDSAIGIQRLNQEAAKAMFAGRRAGLDISDDDALQWITANPAWALGVDAWVGTLEVGKQADLVVWNGTPFSVYAKAMQVYVEGDLVYDRTAPRNRPTNDFEAGFEVTP